MNLVEIFDDDLRSQGLQAHGSQIINTTLIQVDIQPNSLDKNKEIKAGLLPEGWVNKIGITYYCYKNSI